MAKRPTLLSRARILVVEDDRFEQKLIAELVTGLGYDVRSAANGAEAFATVGEFAPDCVVLDLDLGSRPTGLEVLAVLRRRHPHLPAVVLTAYGSPHLVENDAQLPADCSYLVKSRLASPEDLRTAIERALDHRSPVRRMAPDLPAVTRSQAEVLRLLAAGASNEEIANVRGSSKRAVELVVQRVYKRLGVDDTSNPRVEAARIYMRSGVTVR